MVVLFGAFHQTEEMAQNDCQSAWGTSTSPSSDPTFGGMLTPVTVLVLTTLTISSKHDTMHVSTVVLLDKTEAPGRSKFGVACDQKVE